MHRKREKTTAKREGYIEKHSKPKVLTIKLCPCCESEKAEVRLREEIIGTKKINKSTIPLIIFEPIYFFCPKCSKNKNSNISELTQKKHVR